MRRRTLLAAGAVVTVGLAGCSTFANRSPEEEDPESAVQDLFAAVDDGDAEAANGLIGEDASISTISQAEASRLGEANVSVESIEVLNETADRADVRVAFTVTGPEAESVATNERVFELRKRDGSWVLWNWQLGTGSTATRSSTPQVNWEWRDDPEGDLVTLTHAGGDHVNEPGRFVVREDRGTVYGTLEEIVGEEVRVGDSGTINVENQVGTIQLVWQAPESDRTPVVASHEYNVSD